MITWWALCKASVWTLLGHAYNISLNFYRCNGKLLHDATSTTKRWLTGVRREEVQRDLEIATASKYHRKLWTSAGKNPNKKAELIQGNNTCVQSKMVIAKARSDARGRFDLHEHTFMDLIMCQEEMQKNSSWKGNMYLGYMQELFHRPFLISLYTERQLKLLQRLLRLDRGTVLHIDSTGGFTSKLPVEFGATRVLYYSIVVQFPGEEDITCIPLAEFLTNSHGQASISSFLKQYFKR